MSRSCLPWIERVLMAWLAGCQIPEEREMYLRWMFPAFIVAVAILPGACAPQQAGMASPAPAASLSGPANAARPASPMPAMSGMDHSSMPGMDHSSMPSMQGMDMNTMMTHCAQMRQQPSSGQTAQGRQMLNQCDQMDRSMGMTPPRR